MKDGLLRRNIINENFVGLEGRMLEHSIAVGTSPGGLLLHAIPSLSVAHEWICCVLRTMHTQPAPFGIITALYTNLTTTSLCCGKAADSCSSTSTLFALAFDPLVHRCLTRTVCDGERLTVFADDIAVAIACLRC